MKRFGPAAIVLVITGALIVWFFFMVGINTGVLRINKEVGRSIKLCDCTNSTLKVHFTIPEGNSYYLVLGTPGIGMVLTPPYKFSGRVHITSDSASIAEFSIGSDLTQQCNWLQGGGIPWSSALTGSWNTNCPRFDQIVHEQKSYDMEIIFDQPPPSSTSIWLHWIQTIKHKGK